MRSEKPLLALMGVLGLVLLAACQSARVSKPLAQTLAGDDPHTQLEFWHQLAASPLTSNDDAFHGLLLFIDGKDGTPDYAARVRELKSRKLLPNEFAGAADQAIDRGTLAVALVRILGIRGGLTMSILGPVPRYAARALEERDVYSSGSSNQVFTGAEFVGVIGKVEDYRRGNRVHIPASQLPSDQQAQAGEVENPIFLQAAAPTAPAPTSRPASLSIKVTGVDGALAEVRLADDAPWQPVKAGMVVGVGGQFRTGPKSAIRVEIAPDQTLTLDRVGTMRILRVDREERKIVTDIGTFYGRVRYDLEPLPQYQIEEAGLEHDSRIRGPNSTLAVRGTRVILFDQPPYTPYAVSLTGRAFYTNAAGQLVAFGGKRQGVTRFRRDQRSAVEASLEESVVDPSIASARTDAEQALVQSLISRGGVISFDSGTGLTIVRGGRPLTDRELRPVLPGNLNFVARWTGDANLDFAVGNQKGELVYPAPGLTDTPTGGRTAFDHRGGSGGGMEVVYWQGKSSDGFYPFAVNHVSGKPAKLRVDVFQGGKRIGILNPADGTLKTTYSTTVTPGSTAGATVPINVFVPTPVNPPGPPQPPKPARRK